MRSYLRPIISFTLALFAFVLNLQSQKFPDQLLRFYSLSINRITIQWLSRFFGIFPFSVFEWLIYTLVLTLISYLLLSIFRCIKNWRSSITILKWMFLNITSAASIIYFAFIMLWGLNYNRPPLADELQLEVVERTTEELKALTRLLTDRTNNVREVVLEDEYGIFTSGQHYSEIFERAPLGFEALADDIPFLGGDFGRPKAVFASRLMNYTFITGIYSPFTGEPNVNVATPDTTLLFTTMHEIAHQRGIAPEDGANFVAFITSVAHPDPDFQYAGYFNALSYTRSALRQVDPNSIPELNALLSEGVINDINFRVDFWQNFQGPVEQTFEQINNTYLRANGVAEGTQSYGLVVDLLLAYFQDELINYME